MLVAIYIYFFLKDVQKKAMYRQQQKKKKKLLAQFNLKIFGSYTIKYPLAA